MARIHKVSMLADPKHPRATELATFLLAAFLPYAIAESIYLSGITAVLFAGIIADYYTSHHLSTESEHAARYMVQTLSYLGESFIFIYLGMSFFPANNHDFRGGLISLTVVLCFAGRALSIFPLAFLLNLGRKHKIPFKHQMVLWYSGLRGPVAYALAVATPEDPLYPQADNIIISTTLVVVAFTTLLLGGLAYPFIRCLKVALMDSTKEQKTKDYDISHHWFSKLDQKYLKPWFGPDKARGEHALPKLLTQDVNADDDDNDNSEMGITSGDRNVELVDVAADDDPNGVDDNQNV